MAKKKSKVEEVADEIEHGSEKADAIKEIAKAMKNDTTEEMTKVIEMLDRYGAREDSVLKDVMNMIVLQRALKSLESSDGKKEESMADTMREVFKMVLPLRVIQPLIEHRPSQDPLQLITLMKALGAGKDDTKYMETLVRIEQQRAEENRKQLETLQQMLHEKEIQNMKKEQERQREELMSRLQSMEELYLKSKGEEGIATGLAKVLNDYVQVRDAVMKFAEEQGIKKEEVVTPSGKINWGKIVTDWGKRGMSLLEKYLEAQGKQPPAYMPPPLPEAKKAKTDEIPTKKEEKKYEDIVQVSVQEEAPKVEEKPEPAPEKPEPAPERAEEKAETKPPKKKK